MDVGTYIESLVKLDAPALVAETFKNNEAFLIDANITNLKHGLRSNGERIGTYKNDYYARKKNNLNPLAGLGSVDLILTGKFISGITIDFTNEAMIFDSTEKEKGGFSFLDEEVPEFNPTEDFDIPAFIRNK